MNTTLGKKPDQEDSGKQQEPVPAVIRNNTEEIPLSKAIAYSAALHPLVVLFIWGFITLLVIILGFLGLNLFTFHKLEPKNKDIEFVLVNKPEQTPINKNTNLRSDRNSRAGGKHDPTRKISDPEPVSKQSQPQKPSPPVSKPAPQAPKPKPITRPAPQAAPKVPPRPVPRTTPAPPRVAPPTAFSVPVPITKVPTPTDQVGGPVTSGPIASSTPTSAPAPIMAPGSSGSNVVRPSSGYSIGGGNPGNPGPGNPGGAPGIDAIKEPDFGPYMRELQRKIKRNWTPPRGNESKRVVLFFKVSRDGRLLALKLLKTSGNVETDRAAMDAVKRSAPFRQLPPEYKKNDVDIEFTFDYNVFGINGDQY